jgi:hypothetical protein
MEDNAKYSVPWKLTVYNFRRPHQAMNNQTMEMAAGREKLSRVSEFV